MKSVVLCHLYYHDIWDEIKGYLDRLKIDEIYFNLVDEVLKENILKAYPEAKVIISPNQGKDCGGNLRLINEWIKNGAKGDLIFQVHGKAKNRKRLFEAILNQSCIFNLFKNQEVGMAGSKVSWACERWNGSYHEHQAYCRRFGFNTARPMTYIRGTIFVVRAKIYRDFFTGRDIVSLAEELECGNVQEPSNTHAWERLFATIVEEQGYKVKPTTGCVTLM